MSYQLRIGSDKGRTQVKFGILLAVFIPILAACLDSDVSDPQRPGGQPSNPTVATTMVDNDYIGAYPSLAMVPNGFLHASYYAKYGNSEGGGALRHALMQNGIWTVETVDGNIYDAAGDVGRFTSMVSDSDGRIHIVYWDVTNTKLKYALRDEGPGQSWFTNTIWDSDAICGNTDLQQNGAGVLYVGYCDSGRVMVATKEGELWTSEVIPTMGDDLSVSVAIQFDDDNNLHVAYFDPIERKIKYTMKLSGDWQPVEVVTESPLGTDDIQMASAIDGDGNLHVIFYDIAQETIAHAQKSSGQWLTSVIEEVGDVAYSSSISFLDFSTLTDHLGKIHVFYYSGIYQDLHHAELGADGWTSNILVEDGDVGRSSAVTEDENGTIHIIYRDSTNDDLRYAYF